MNFFEHIPTYSPSIYVNYGHISTGHHAACKLLFVDVWDSNIIASVASNGYRSHVHLITISGIAIVLHLKHAGACVCDTWPARLSFTHTHTHTAVSFRPELLSYGEGCINALHCRTRSHILPEIRRCKCTHTCTHMRQAQCTPRTRRICISRACVCSVRCACLDRWSSPSSHNGCRLCSSPNSISRSGEQRGLRWQRVRPAACSLTLTHSVHG